MAYVIATSRKDRLKYIRYRAERPSDSPVPKELQGAAFDVSMLEACKLNPLASQGSRLQPEAL